MPNTFFHILGHLCGIKDSSCGINGVGKKAENTAGMRLGEKVVGHMMCVLNKADWMSVLGTTGRIK